jgi:hypothetical protein
MKKLLGLIAGFFALLATAPALAATPIEVAYTGALGSSANVKAPFNAANSGFTPSMAFSGTFYYDPGSVPATGVTNVAFNTLTGIPANEAFTINFGPLSFNLADNISSLLMNPGIQYNNGQFNGFVFVTDFNYGGNYYQFRANGPTITVKLLDGISNSLDPRGNVGTTNYIGAKITTGNTNLSQVVPTDLEGAVPEPATWAMMLLGFGGIGFAMRRMQKAPLTQVA